MAVPGLRFSPASTSEVVDLAQDSFPNVTPQPISDHAPSLWQATAPPGPDATALSGEVTADIVVIGGGFTGLSCAIHAAESGQSVVVLEAREIGSGASGRNNGQVIPTLTKPDPDNLIGAFGPEAGERFVRLLGGSASNVFDLVRRHEIDCDAEQNGWVQPVHTPGRMAIAERRVSEWSRRGMDVDLIDRDAMRSVLGSEAWHGGWTARTGGTINPLALARGMAGAFLKLGGRIFTQSPATNFEQTSEGWKVETAEGTVSAGGLMLATNAYTDTIEPKLRREVVPVLSWQMATEPLTDNIRKTLLPGRQAVSDTHGDLRFFRYDRDGRLVTGGALIVSANATSKLPLMVAERLQEAFAQLGDVRFSHIWNGYIGMTTDYTPRFHRLGSNGFAWAGCNGRGVALSIAAGREFAELLGGKPTNESALPFTDIKPIPLQPVLRHVAPLKLGLYRWRDSQEV